jgi:hypothetical protein
MAFEKGHSGNPAGRKVGTSNKATAHAREVIADALAGTDADKLRAKLAALEGKDFIDAYVKLAEFITPKMQRTTLPTEQEKGPMKVTLRIGGRTPEEQEANRENNGREVTRLLNR